MLGARYRRILFFFARVLFSLAVWEIGLPALRLGGWAARTRSDRLRRIAIRFRLLAVQMGGVMIKVGQFLSSRLDVLPLEITAELAGLQDEVPPEQFSALRLVAENEFGAPLESLFVRFDSEPLAAASLGQVHRAWIDPQAAAEAGLQSLSTVGGESAAVVVKIQRPNIAAIIQTDLAALAAVGRWVARYRPVSRRADVPALMQEFTRILNQEIDYLQEGLNAEAFAKNFAGDPRVRVPAVVWSRTRLRVLTLEDVQAIKITDYAAIEAAGIDRGEVARVLLNTYLKQIFEDHFFHADPHPGNLFVYPIPSQASAPQMAETGAFEHGAASHGAVLTWQLTFVDFGMVGLVPPSLRAGLRELVIAVGTRDAGRMVRAYQLLGVLLPSADLSLIEQVEGELFAHFWGKNMSELQQIDLKEVRELSRRFGELLYQLPFQVPEDLVLLGRTVGILSGMCTGLDPNFNVWQPIVPFARRLIAEEPSQGLEYWLENLGKLARQLAALPGRTETVLDLMARGELRLRNPELEHQVGRAGSQVSAALIFAALLLAGVQLLLAEFTPWAQIVLAGAALALVWILIFAARTGRR